MNGVGPFNKPRSLRQGILYYLICDCKYDTESK